MRACPHRRAPDSYSPSDRLSLHIIVLRRYSRVICPADKAVVAAVAALIDTALVELTTGPDGALRRLNESVDAALLVRTLSRPVSIPV